MVSQTVEYALRAMSHVAVLNGLPATCESIARTTRVPRSYLAKIMRGLVNAQLVQSFRGPKGGFVLARAPHEISLLDIVNAVDPIRRIIHCPLDNPRHLSLCPLHQCLDDALAHIEQRFDAATLAGVLENSGHMGCCRTLFQLPTSGEFKENP